MIRFELLRDAGVLVVESKSALSAEDFREISRSIDPYITATSIALPSLRTRLC